MSLRGLVVLLVGLVVAVALLIGLGRDKPAATPAPSEAPLLASFDEASVREITVACEGASLTLRRGADEGWRLQVPSDLEADPRRVRELVSALQDAKVRKVIETHGANPGAFGLEPAPCRARVVLGSGERTLRLGRTSPVGTERYASVDGASVVLTDGSLYTALARSADAYREKRLVPVEPDAVTRLVIDRGGERLALSRASGAWQLESPVRDRASEAACAQLARAVAGITLEIAPSNPHRIEARADRRIALEVAARGAARPLAGFVARAGIGGKRVAWRGDGALLGLVEESSAQELERPADAYRDRRVVSFSSPDVRSIDVARAGRRIRIERAGESAGWSCREDATSVAADADRVNTFLERLRVLTAVGFGAEPPPTAPTGSVTIGGASAELARMAWGTWPPDPAGRGESLWVTTPERPGVVFKVLATDVGPIPEHAGELAGPAPGTGGSGS